MRVKVIRFYLICLIFGKQNNKQSTRVLMSLFTSLYTAFIENILVLFGVIISNIHCISSRFFEIQPKEISSQVSEKASKVRLLYDKPEKVQTHSNEKIGKEKKRANFYNSSFVRGAASFSTIVVGLR